MKVTHLADVDRPISGTACVFYPYSLGIRSETETHPEYQGRMAL